MALPPKKTYKPGNIHNKIILLPPFKVITQAGFSFPLHFLQLRDLIAAILHKNSETALIPHPFQLQSKVLGVLGGDIERQNDHLDITLPCRGREH